MSAETLELSNPFETQETPATPVFTVLVSLLARREEIEIELRVLDGLINDLLDSESLVVPGVGI